MTSYWAKRRRVIKIVKDAEQEILQEFEDTIVKQNTNAHLNNSIPTNCEKGQHSADQCVVNVSVDSGNQAVAPNADTLHSNNEFPPTSDTHSPHGSAISEGSDSDSDEHEPNLDTLPIALKCWATAFSIPLVALTALLCILGVFHPNLPRDGRTLLGTQSKVPTCKMGSGEYYHFGLEQGLLSRLKCLSLPRSLKRLHLQFNIDGLPLFKSSRLQFWPILALVECDYTRSPFVVGLYCGISKPGSIYEYLQAFIKDLTHLLANGIIHNGRRLQVLVSSFICDAPARAYVKHIKSHNGYSGCDKCFQVGEWKNKMTFPDTNVKLRTDTDFAAMVDEEHHLEQKHGPLTGVVKMVSQFPIDYMHLCCLGVTRKLLRMWLKGKKLTTRFPSQTVGMISKKLVMLRPHTPVEFARKPRDLTEIDRWKATELRQFMLYTGPVVLKDFLSSELYDNFMLFSVGIFLLLSPGISEEMVDFAHKVLVSFVRHFGELYGKEEIVFSIHQVIHLADEYRNFGPLDNISGFPFENYLGQIKRLLRKPHQPLQQVVKRLSEMPTVLRPMPTDKATLHNLHYDGPLPPQFCSAEQFRKVTTNDYTLSIEQGDNCIQIGDEVAVVKNIVKVDGDIFVLYQKFTHYYPYFSYPCRSTYIGCYKVCQLHDNIGMDNKVVQWCVVEFEDKSAAVVPRCWFENDKRCLWPPFDSKKLLKAIKEQQQPGLGWSVHEPVRRLATCETHEIALNCLRKSVQTDCGTSDLQSDEETGQRKKRKSKPNPRYSNRQSDSDDDSSCVKKRPFAKPPAVISPERIETQGSSCSPRSTLMQNPEQSRNDLPDREPKRSVIQAPTQTRNESFYGDCSLPDQYFHDSQRGSSPRYHLMSTPEQARNGSYQGEYNVLHQNAYGAEMPWKQESRQLMKENSDSLVTTPSILLPLKSIEEFNEAERVLQRETVRRKMVSRFAMVGGVNTDTMVRRMLTSALTNKLASSFNWAGKGDKAAYKDTVRQDCMFDAVQQQTKGTTHLAFSEIVKKWLRYAPERDGGIPRK